MCRKTTLFLRDFASLNHLFPMKNFALIPASFTKAENGAPEVLDFFSDVAKGTAKGVVGGVCGIVRDLLDGCTHVCRGEFGRAADIAVKRGAGMVTGAVGMLEAGVGLTASGADALLHDRDFLTEENKRRMTLLGQAAVYAAAGGALMGDDAPSGDGCTLHGDACLLPGVENGVFTGSPDDLQALIAAGENPDAEHVPADDVSRSPAVKAAFLDAHGIDDPGDWQVHHVEPVSMGGADAPENMVLISPEDHQTVTAAHAKYYKWADRG